jgi:hypothetical protein
MPFLLTGLQLSTINNQQSIFVPIGFAVETSTLFDEEGLAQALKAIPINSRICLHDENNDIDVYPQDVGGRRMWVLEFHKFYPSLSGLLLPNRGSLQ